MIPAFCLQKHEGRRENNPLQPYQLVSLWELMERFEAGTIYSAALRLSHILRPYEIKTANHTHAITQESYIEAKGHIDFLCEELERIGFGYALPPARELHQLIHEQIREGQIAEPGIWMELSPETTYNYRAHVRDLVTTLERELSSRIIMFLPERMVGYYDGSKCLFPGAVLDKFGSLQYDMNQAGKCFAFGQHTACVFHLMRVLEIVLRKFAQKLRISPQVFERKEWGVILNQINNKLKCEPNDSARIRKRKDRQKVTSGFLNGVRMAWRNDTIHVRADYDEDGASKVIAAVRLFVEDFAKLPR